ncbi:uncharacterized protein UV8b_00059 [Ustilaginoidea virens]|uniref:Rab-GAP TBC domain-containing protein n=1 Tax=Ustilaginoidea virens TaxID=1159556 RepID=A0A8E5HI92_USTVR|nr:uncharacterized protein UV8b_00059 [Ustilaginoidea virens]QUC15818.1 hypothetical protein UV8b_00059 [Ustilaginoidea virens]
MDPITSPQSGEDGPDLGQRTVRNRKCSLYASRVKPFTAESSMPTDTPQIPDVPSLPMPSLPMSPPRWDSLAHGPHLLNQSNPTAAPSTAPIVSPEVSPIQSIPILAGSVTIPTTPKPGSIITGTSEPRSESPSRSLKGKTSLADMRSAESSPVIENFSRPRKQSIRQNGPPEAMPGAETLKPPRLANLAAPGSRAYDLSNPLPQTPPWQRPPRRPSESSVKSTCVLASPLPHQAVDYGEPRSHRARNVTGPPALAPSRAPWLGGDELRCSFRSQLTASTTPGTAVTERSSVLTKGSSVTSLENPDEPSLEDVMGMYEKGFADDEDDDNNDGNFERHQSEPDMSTRPIPAVLEPEMRLSPTACDFPPDAEIRQSKMIFTSSAFTSSVAAISGGKADVDATEKRDSAKSLDSEPSAASSPVAPIDRGSQPTILTRSSPSPTPSPTATAASPAFASIAVEPEDPGSRDRYGFKKANQSVTREQYDSWNQEYSVYLARRRRKWVGYLKDCALMTERPNRFPSPCAKTKRFVRKGIPPDWRGAAWFYYAGGPAILAKHSGLYEKLLHKQAKLDDIEAIERDLHRTFPDNIQFKPSTYVEPSPSSSRNSQSTMTRSSTDDNVPGPSAAASNEPPIITSLRRVLHAFSVYNPRIGYCQSLNFLAGLLLLFVETEEQCFWLLNVITIIYLPGTHDMSLEGSKVDLGVLMTELRDSMPSVWEKIGGELENLPTGRPSTSKSVRKARPILRRREQAPGLSTERLPPITLCMTAWFMSCYIGTLPIETTLRVWDVFFYEGSKTLFRIALAIFKTGEHEIKAVHDPMEMFGVVQAIPRRMIDANALMEACFKRRNGFGHLTQGVIDERRQERRDRSRQELERKLCSEKTDLDGNPAEAEPGTVSRKGTLFGKKKKGVIGVRPAEV